VFVGLMASFGKIEYIVFGILTTIAIYYGRALVSKITLTKKFSKLDKAVTKSMIPRGLAAAVLATYPITMGLPNSEAYSQIVFFIILSSVMITTVGFGKSKRIPPPESIEGGFVKPENIEENIGKEQTETLEDFQNESVEGGFVKPTEDSQRK
jgi:cell volume regulation protein A